LELLARKREELPASIDDLTNINLYFNDIVELFGYWPIDSLYAKIRAVNRATGECNSMSVDKLFFVPQYLTEMKVILDKLKEKPTKKDTHALVKLMDALIKDQPSADEWVTTGELEEVLADVGSTTADMDLWVTVQFELIKDYVLTDFMTNARVFQQGCHSSGKPAAVLARMPKALPFK